jgi:hypothetical protein
MKCNRTPRAHAHVSSALPINRPVVDDEFLRHAARVGHADQRLDDAGARQRRVDVTCQRLAAELVHDVEDAKGPARGQLVLHEIHRPTLIDAYRRDDRGRRGAGATLSLPAAHRQAFRAIEPIDAFVVHAHPFAS